MGFYKIQYHVRERERGLLVLGLRRNDCLGPKLDGNLKSRLRIQVAALENSQTH